MTNQPTAIREQPQTSFEEQELDDPGLLTALNAWAETDAYVDEMKAEAKPYTKNLDAAKEVRDEAQAAVNARLSVLEIEIVGTENVYRAGIYRLVNKHRAEAERNFTVEEKDSLKIERAAS